MQVAWMHGWPLSRSGVVRESNSVLLAVTANYMWLCSRIAGGSKRWGFDFTLNKPLPYPPVSLNHHNHTDWHLRYKQSSAELQVTFPCEGGSLSLSAFRLSSTIITVHNHIGLLILVYFGHWMVCHCLLHESLCTGSLTSQPNNEIRGHFTSKITRKRITTPTITDCSEIVYDVRNR